MQLWREELIGSLNLYLERTEYLGGLVRETLAIEESREKGEQVLTSFLKTVVQRTVGDLPGGLREKVVK